MSVLMIFLPINDFPNRISKFSTQQFSMSMLDTYENITMMTIRVTRLCALIQVVTKERESLMCAIPVNYIHHHHIHYLNDYYLNSVEWRRKFVIQKCSLLPPHRYFPHSIRPYNIFHHGDFRQLTNDNITNDKPYCLSNISWWAKPIRRPTHTHRMSFIVEHFSVCIIILIYQIPRNSHHHR